ncbi:hypothetical protein JRO89_XS03G0226300 [Xanthoceras sorbifolium]|uniref:Auxin-responsive protein n=1 Tax=Xanthoceras sorbifolium TaxID=99658 RepID=A0ABQ8IC95_9ROSI|nr:hypothetical protein JRO89_XS03G0226300 [Xanthoceras sorbifolium]
MGRDDIDEEGAHSCSSSIDSSKNPADNPFISSPSCGSFVVASKRSSKDLSTDLKLGLSISPSHNDVSSTSTQREQRFLDWPPIKPLLRSTLAGHGGHVSLFVKVYMEGIPIGRKLDLFAHQGYNALITNLSHMFTTTIRCPDDTPVDHHRATVDHSEKYHVLTYEDKEGDWMMVGDVPWEMFLTTVKRLKIARADRC